LPALPVPYRYLLAFTFIRCTVCMQVWDHTAVNFASCAGVLPAGSEAFTATTTTGSAAYAGLPPFTCSLAFFLPRIHAHRVCTASACSCTYLRTGRPCPAFTAAPMAGHFRHTWTMRCRVHNVTFPILLRYRAFCPVLGDRSIDLAACPRAIAAWDVASLSFAVHGTLPLPSPSGADCCWSTTLGKDCWRCK